MRAVEATVQAGSTAEELPGGGSMTEQQLVIESIVRTIKTSGLPRGLLWQTLSERVRLETRCTHDEMDEAVLEAMDQCIVEEKEIGWIRIVEDPEAKRKADDAALERHIDGQADRDQANERAYDAGRQHSAEGR